jgi:hypothetical protein
MSKSSPKEWIHLRQDLFARVHSHVEALLGEPSKALEVYQREYEQEFSKSWKISVRAALFAKMEHAQFIFVGDFHALRQSQKAQLRLLKGLKNPKDLILCVEFIEARHQKYMDAYLAGKMSEREFLRAVEWKRNWGFPFDHYRPLIRFAQKNKVRIFGINLRLEGRSLKTLRKRDVFSANKIAEINRSFPTQKLFITFGDMHLAKSHLPKKLRALLGEKVEKKSIFIFQNSEKIYFQLLKKEIEHQVDIVRLSENRFCLQNVPPWVKWQNYLTFLEMQYDRDLDDEIDLTDDVARYVKIIAQDLGISVRSDHFEIYGSEDAKSWDQLQKGLKSADIKFVRSWIEDGRSFWVPQTGVGFLARSSVNSVAQLAMSIVFAELSGQKKLLSLYPQDFLKLIWFEAVQYFGSKMINPKRKTSTLNDLKLELFAKNPVDKGREALQLALKQKMLELMHLSGSRKARESLGPAKLKAAQEAAKILGGMLGEKMYYAYRKKILSKANLVGILRKPIESPEFQNIYWEILEIIENFPEPFQSKAEKL